MFFTFHEDARWNAERQAVEFGVQIGEYRGVVRVRGAYRANSSPLALFTKDPMLASPAINSAASKRP
jgi:hypothetical protein